MDKILTGAAFGKTAPNAEAAVGRILRRRPDSSGPLALLLCWLVRAEVAAATTPEAE